MAFAFVHIHWLAGGTAGLPDGQSLMDNTPLLIVDVIAIPASFAAAALGLALVRPWGARIRRGMLLAGAWTATGVMVVHTLPSVGDWVALTVGTRTADELTSLERFATFVYEPWFLAGGLLFGLAAFTFQRRTH